MDSFLKRSLQLLTALLYMQSDGTDMHQDFGYAADLAPDPTFDLLNQVVTFLNSHFGINEYMEIHPHHAAHSAPPEPDQALLTKQSAGDTLEL